MSSVRPCRSAPARAGSAARWASAIVFMLVLAAFGALASSAGAHTPPQVNIVRQGTAPAKVPAGTHYFKHIQEAVDASSAGDYVLIEPGIYDESVRVTSAQSGIWIRGLNRNTVILDGQHKAGNGILIEQANDVWVENLTVRNFDEGSSCGDEECGNEIWWDGGSGSRKIGAHGWYGSYLTAYDTGLDGGYGIFTNNEVEGAWEHIYASGFNDSGMYLGACQECDARITGAVIEDNALGYSGSNSGGRLVIENSLFRHNSVGVDPNSENPGDPPPPQDGECGRPNIEDPNPTPLITSTRIHRCTIIRHNVIVENNNLTAPAVGNPDGNWGSGVLLTGDYADLVEANVIAGNTNDGVLGLEYPNPFPPGPETIYFQLAGNRISDNLFIDNGHNPTYKGNPYAGDLTLTGGYSPLFGGPESHSEDNCASDNLFTDATFPAKIEGTWGCQNATTPNPGYGGLPVPPAEFPPAVEYLLQLKVEAESRHPVDQPAPPPQPTMPDPCEGVPRNPLCP